MPDSPVLLSRRNTFAHAPLDVSSAFTLFLLAVHLFLLAPLPYRTKSRDETGEGGHLVQTRKQKGGGEQEETATAELRRSVTQSDSGGELGAPSSGRTAGRRESVPFRVAALHLTAPGLRAARYRGGGRAPPLADPFPVARAAPSRKPPGACFLSKPQLSAGTERPACCR